MRDFGHHAEWLSLVEISGPFLAEPVLKEAFPQGLAGLDGAKKKMIRQAYDEWREAIDLDEPDARKVHRAWIELVLRQGLEFDEDGFGDVLKIGGDVAAIKCDLPEYGVTLTPDFVVTDGQGAELPLMLVSVYDPEIVLGEAFKQGTWSASPAERMVTLCRATGVRLGLVTNGEQWMLVDAPVGAVTTFASWYARLWSQEPITLQAFVNLLGIRRFFVDRTEQLPALLDNSVKFQDEVTDALGEQVRRAVEVLIQALDRADVDRNRDLLLGVEPSELYEAGLTVMMRIVFLLAAEERGLLLLGDERYEANYAVSTLRLQLRAESEEILERRWDAWSRLLSVFRAVYGGIEHEALRLPALGGSLFDPDRFPFLEGRAKGSRWKVDLATPLPIDNGTVLLLLEAVQLFRGRALSYRALDVEQIGYVYEGLLERTVVRASEITLDLDATKLAKNPWVTLAEIEDASAQGQNSLEDLLKERMDSSASRVRNDLNKPRDADAAEKLLTACQADRALQERVEPYFHLLRTDLWGYPLVYPKGTLMVKIGGDRRQTGTHYTPKSLTEVVVRDTLEPLVYVGPAHGTPREDWVLKSAAELLDLKICDPAMGSGAFLVQVCRWLSERLTESWGEAEDQGKCITSEGQVAQEIGAQEPLSKDAEERSIVARRLLAERCLYGVDVNPLAVELAKLSIWLVTLAKGRPFGFLDHNLRCGDSLLGINRLEQLSYLDMRPDRNSSKKLFAATIDQSVEKAILLRSDLRSRPIRDIRDVEVMAGLDRQARQSLELPELVADALIADVLAAGEAASDKTDLSIEAGGAMEGNEDAVQALKRRAHEGLETELSTGKVLRRPFHWPLEFPEVFFRDNKGFDAIVGNPPFLGGKKISTMHGFAYRTFISQNIAQEKGAADLCAYFFLRARSLLRGSGVFGFLATNTICQGITREISLAQIEKTGSIFRASASCPWPGAAGVDISIIHVFNGKWQGERVLDGDKVGHINSYLTSGDSEDKPHKLLSSIYGAKGTYVYGEGFIVDENQYQKFLLDDEANAAILQRYLVARDFTAEVDHMPTSPYDCWA
ncbi:DNA methyltransferase [Mesorhizobium sp. M0060]|uniref:Eco57I restriction-modification methylase domain-containing protein n=1 Tax=Mesorhizobium sp. M0060 TaxID=2956866 RepID=UPI00333A0CEC